MNSVHLHKNSAGTFKTISARVLPKLQLCSLPLKLRQAVATELQSSSQCHAQTSGEPFETSRRTVVHGLVMSLFTLCINSHNPALALETLAPAIVRPELAPDQSKYDPADPDLRAAANLLQEGLNASDVVLEEEIWTRIIETYSGMDKPWVPDVVGRAWGNRGNARSRQGKLEAALSDYNQSIAICPWSVDPVLNRGVVLEALGRYEEAITDYKAVLAAAPEDPAGWNNLGNASAGLGRWQEAADYYTRATQLSAGFSFASANRALALYQLGQTNQAVKEMRNLLRKYPAFTDVRAGLAAALWGLGLEGQAESQWERVDDPRYKDPEWLKTNRRWPPTLINNLEAFLKLKSVSPAAV